MSYLFRCRGCKGPPIAQIPDGLCIHCSRPYRYERVSVPIGTEGAIVQPVKEGEPISAADLMASAELDEDMRRQPTGLKGVDWIFGGNGIPTFGTVLLGARRGSGKTTFIYELFCSLAEQGIETLLVTSEQSLKGIKRQLARCKKAPLNLTIHSENDKDSVMDCIGKEKATVVAIDSLHNLINITDESGYEMANGTPRAVERVAREACDIAEEQNKVIFMIGHLNNDGTMAGGQHLQHLVDAVLKISWSGIKTDKRRVLEWDGKCRFGEIDRRALFTMGEDGLKDCGPLIEEPEFDFKIGKDPSKMN